MNELKEKLRELLEQLDGLKEYYERLTERERMIVLASGGGVVAFLLVIILSIIAGSNSSISTRIEKSRNNLDQIRAIQEKYQETEKQVSDLEIKIRRTSPGFQLGTHLENLAREHGIASPDLKPPVDKPNDFFREQQVQVSVKEVSLMTLIEYLYAIENGTQFLKIASLQIKPTFRDATKLNATFTVSTFQPI